jgi:hypothetical protein
MSVWSVPIGSPADPSSILEEVLATKINIPEALHSSAIDTQNSLRRLLAEEARRDPGFPRLLVEADQDFIGGSFGRRTKIRPLDDIDIYIPVDGAGLLYNCRGVQSCALLSDNATFGNPLSGAAWMATATAGEHLSSEAILAAFANVLSRRYLDIKRIRKVGEALRIPLALGDDLGFDVVPCFVLDYPNSRELRVYLIPDGNDGWFRTNPRYDVALTDALSQRTNKNFRKAAKILKFWNSSIFGNKLSSYYIELALQKAVLEQVTAGQSLEPLSFAVAFAFWALDQALRSGNLNAWVTDAPQVTPGSLSPPDFDLVSSLASVAWQAWEQERKWQLQEATSSWEVIFGAK